ncbi:hypothetical protein HN709_01300 [Candidatus Peregrinibacteria bacterium]|jgi:uncharacterized integral membrane protein|nr:hypothetical protein [Candidatus Peregrinibacteria bacterium]MBT7736300.1 hypothetical protein [Candidatus Peregrinibacteria bacterium]
MKALYLTLSIIFTVLLLLLAFGNIAAQCSGVNFLFFQIQSNPTLIFLGVGVLGILTGMFYNAFLRRVLETSPEDEDSDFE